MKEAVILCNALPNCPTVYRAIGEFDKKGNFDAVVYRVECNKYYKKPSEWIKTGLFLKSMILEYSIV